MLKADCFSPLALACLSDSGFKVGLTGTASSPDSKHYCWPLPPLRSSFSPGILLLFSMVVKRGLQ